MIGIFNILNGCRVNTTQASGDPCSNEGFGLGFGITQSFGIMLVDILSDDPLAAYQGPSNVISLSHPIAAAGVSASHSSNAVSAGLSVGWGVDATNIEHNTTFINATDVWHLINELVNYPRFDNSQYERPVGPQK